MGSKREKSSAVIKRSNPQTKEVEGIISDLITEEHRLTKWEQDFLTSINDQVYEGRELTEKQLETLRNVHQKYC